MAKYDLYFQPVAPDAVQGYHCFEFGYQAALKVTGFRSLINRWIKTFLTPIGSDPLDRTYGTPAGNLIGSNVSSLGTEVQDVVALSVVEANSQVQQQDIDGLFPDDERLQSATIERYTESADGFQVWIAIKNAAGEKLAVPVLTLGEARV